MEMGLLFFMVLPLPHVIRRKFVKAIERLQASSNFKIGVIFISTILGLQFMDCLQRLRKFDYLKNPYFTTSNTSTSNTMLSNDQLASKFYSQRNLYISGAVLYLELAIFTVSTILKKLVAKKDTLRSMNVKKEFGTKKEEANKYKELIKVKQEEINNLKKDIKSQQEKL